MKRKVEWKLILIFLVIGFSIYFFVPPSKKVKLGLDLKGGMHLVLQVVTDDAVKMERDQEILRLKSLLEDEGIKVGNIYGKGIATIAVEGVPSERERDFDALIKANFGNWEYSGVVEGKAELNLKPKVITAIRENAVEEALETIRRRVDEFGIAEPVIQRQGLHGDKIVVELPGVDDPKRVRALIKNTALLELKLVKDGPFPTKEDALKKYGGKLPEDLQILPSRGQGYYVVERAAAVTGRDLKTARRCVDKYNLPAVCFQLNAEGARKFEKVTSQNVGRQLAIVLDNVIESAPSIRSTIFDSGIIEGSFTGEEAHDLALILRTGSLPASIKIIEERTIGPSLGADSIRKGLKASVLALVLVMLFMILYYNLAGVNATIALIMNMIIIFGALSLFRAALTLPGIAGIVLTIGMSVDANVLIFERIREELRNGKSPIAAIDAGFARAFTTILDANLTTIIAAIFLFSFGTGPIKGFAVTLIIGIIASIFTAVFVSKTIFELLYFGKRKVEKISI